MHINAKAFYNQFYNNRKCALKNQTHNKYIVNLAFQDACPLKYLKQGRYFTFAPQYITYLIFLLLVPVGLFHLPPKIRIEVFLPTGTASTAS